MTDRNKKTIYRRPEVLAPAGTMEALVAAVNAGADAVYVGGSFFSARAFAGNFDEEELIRAIKFCHLYGVKLYMTVNTLLKSDEMERLPAYMEPYYHAGVDGIIVQDVGVAAVLKEHFPDLPLHGSTQMSITSRHGAALLKSMGFTRVVPARELSIEEIKNIKANVDIEIETFIHGAMCFAYSGKCLLSSYLGGRSGNRGRCAQPCRHMYKINTPSGTVNEYAMSLKDMNTLSLIPEIIAAGIDSLKIEGRMKKPEYVASTVAAYVKAVDWWMDKIEAEGQAACNVSENSTGYSGDADGASVTSPAGYAESTSVTSPVKAAGGISLKDIITGKEEQQWLSLVGTLTEELRDIYNRGGFSEGYYKQQNGYTMVAADRPNHTGVFAGSIESVKAPEIFLKTAAKLNAGDVLEIRTASGDIEITCGKDALAGSRIGIKARDIKKIRPGDEVYRTRNNALIERIRKEIIEKSREIVADCLVETHVGEPLTIRLFYEKAGIELTIQGPEVQKAQNRPLSAEDIKEKMLKTGGSGVRLNVSVNADPDCFLPVKELNELRRRAVEELKAKIIGQYRR